MAVKYKSVEITYFNEENNFWCVDAWTDPDVDDNGKVVGVIHRNGDAYIFDPDAVICEHVKEVVADKVAEIKDCKLAIGTDPECVSIRLTENSHPEAFKTKMNELVKGGMSESEARAFIAGTPFNMEVFYSPDRGLFAVESEAIECTAIFDPYTSIQMELKD